MARPSKYSPEVRERFVRMVQEHTTEHGSQWAAIAAIAPKVGLHDARRCDAGCARPSAMPASAPA